MNELLEYPFDSITIMKKKKAIKNSLIANDNLITKKIAILGGSSTTEIKNILELFLLDAGIKPVFYESEYNKYYEDAIFGNSDFDNFKPDYIYIHNSAENIEELPSINDSENQVEEKLNYEFGRYVKVWDALFRKFESVIIQNTFPMLPIQYLGNIDSVDFHGLNSFVLRLNSKITDYARKEKHHFLINDLNYLSAKIGLEKWYDLTFWHAYKFAMSYEAIPEVAFNVFRLINASLGKSKKCIILDLDNTLWGGVIGDDGINGLAIGKETPIAEAYTAFQKYLLLLKARGILLAVCSKNDLDIAKEGFNHPESLLKFDDFVAFKANWNPKHNNIVELAKEINIGLDSIIFVDDNPAERQIVRENLPVVSVPEININNVANFPLIIDRAGYFETIAISADDLKRNKAYEENATRKNFEQNFKSYDDYLLSLEMKAIIKSFEPIYLERIAQLTNKTNQFNLTTKRYTVAEIEKISKDDNYIALYGKLFDKFGDNGLISVVIGEIKENGIHINLWLMSCRVLKRGMELAMFDKLVEECIKRGIKEIYGYYYKTQKNSMVSDQYKALNFEALEITDDYSFWKYEINDKYVLTNKFINVN